MKTILNLLTLLFAFLIFQSFTRITTNGEYKNYELKQNETVTFKDGPNSKADKFSASYKRGSYDHTRYEIVVDTGINLIVSNITECAGKHQNELSLILCSGIISRNEDTLKIHDKTINDKLYLFNVEKNRIVDSMTPDIQIDIISKTLKNEYCPNLFSNAAITGIVALPKDVNTDEIYKAFHKDNTVGVFTYFKVADSNGRSKMYSAGDYVLIGGNSLNFSK